MAVATHPRAVPLVAPAGEGERIWIAGDTVRIAATSAETGGVFTMLEVEVAPGSGPPLHLHEREEEAFYVLAGVFEFAVGDREVRGGPGTVVLVPRGTPHRWHAAGGPGRMLIVFTPAGLERFFREAGRAAGGDGPAPPVDAAEIARTDEAGRRHGLRALDWGP